MSICQNGIVSGHRVDARCVGSTLGLAFLLAVQAPVCRAAPGNLLVHTRRCSLPWLCTTAPPSPAQSGLLQCCGSNRGRGGADLSALTMPHRHDGPAPALNSHSTRPASLDYVPSSQSSARTSARPLGSVAERGGRRRNRRSGPMTVGNAAAAFAMPAPRERARLAWPRRIRRRVIFRRVIGRRWVMGRRSVTPVVEGRRPSEHS